MNRSILTLALIALASGCFSGPKVMEDGDEVIELTPKAAQVTSAEKIEDTAPLEVSSSSTPEIEDSSDPALVGTEETKTDAPKVSTSSVEILWQVPGEAVSKYTILYGEKKGSPEERIEIKVHDLDKIAHPDHGPLYRYTLRNIPLDKTIYVSVIAENDFGASPASTAVEIPGG